MHQLEQPLFAPSYFSIQLNCQQVINNKYIPPHDQSDMKRQYLTPNQSAA